MLATGSVRTRTFCSPRMLALGILLLIHLHLAAHQESLDQKEEQHCNTCVCQLRLPGRGGACRLTERDCLRTGRDDNPQQIPRDECKQELRRWVAQLCAQRVECADQDNSVVEFAE